MPSEPIILSDPRVLAEFMRQDEFKAFFEKRFAVPPDYAALLFKNGEMIDAFKGGHFSVGGLVDRIKSIVGGSTHVAMMIADLKPFQVQSPVKAISSDKVDLAGTATFELQVDPDKPSNILGMMHGISRVPTQGDVPGRKALTKVDVLNRLRPHLTDRVFESTLGRMKATEIRGNNGLQDKLQADAMTEAERILGDLGLVVRACSIEWALNAEEQAEQARTEALRQQEEIDFQIEMARRQSERVKDATVFSIESDLDMARLQNATEDELKQMALNSEIRFIDAREEARRRQELEEIAHQIEVLEVERKGQFENAIANAQTTVELKQLEQEQLKIDTEMDRMRQLHLQEMKRSGAFSELEVSGLAQKQQREHLAGLQEIELRAEQVRFEMERVRRKEESDFNLAKLNTQKDMTPEQILAVQAGLSPDVAMVLAERARADAGSNQEAMTMMRELVEAATASQIRSEEQAREMFKMGMHGAVGVAAGAGGGSAPVSVSNGDSTAELRSAAAIDCPKCSTENDAKSRFCLKCGHKLRT